MSYIIFVSLSAREETLDAVHYYDKIRTGLSDEFLADLEERYTTISKNPYAFSYTDKRCVLRDVLLNRFPILIIYKILSDTGVIISIHNTHKKPAAF